MYDEATLRGIASSLIEREDAEPAGLLCDLMNVQAEQREVRRDQRRYELRLELDEDDMETVMAEVRSRIEENDG